MKCDCSNNTMDYVECFDTGSSGKDISYNIYQCSDCGTIKIEHVWSDPKVITIPAHAYYCEDIAIRRSK